ncbi:MAG TPA: hypothetical protein V6D46_04370, partial [Coleofasciculaceae cyanobacterium]
MSRLMAGGLGLAAGFLLGALPVSAHTVKAGQDVAALFHLEPDHNPRSGEPARIWFGLTRKGGAAIPFDRCDCQLEIMPRVPNAAGPKPWQPTLEAVAAEGFQNMPGATTTFPAAGAYELVLRGRPKQPGDFQPFEFRYETTVLAGAAIASPAPAADRRSTAGSIAPPSSSPESGIALWPLGVLGLVGLGFGGWGVWAIGRSRRG